MLDPSTILLWFDLPSLFKFLFTLLLFGIAAVYLVRDTASRYLIAGETRVPDDEDEAADESTGSGTMGDQILTTTVDENCFVCGGETTKKCSRCKAVRYCSSQCQSKDWAAGHSKRCRKIISGEVTLKVTTGCMDKRDDSSSQNGTRNIPGSASSVSSGCKIIKQPKEVLYPYDDFLELFDWNKTGLPPCGLLNCGNSCFANVVLQCLTSTRPLIAYLLERDHARECTRYDWCFLCELRLHVVRVKQSFEPFSPRNILSRIFNVGGSFGYGKQEDAHEFMRFAIDTMQSVCLDEFGGEKNIDSKIQETTLIHHIFGGHLQSQVICSKCGAISNRYEKMMDLTVEIHGNAGSLEECLDQFTSKEWLEGDNMYKCDICNDYVSAWKRLTIYQAPNILTIALKRFQSGRFGKLNKRVSFPETLDLGSYMGGSGDGADIYKLYAVVVHVDMLNASYFGHYICYTKDSNGIWYRIDDCKVMEVELEEVLSQRAYMLLYSRVHARKQIAEAAPKSQNTNDACKQKAANGTQSIADIVEASLISHSASPTSLVLPTEMSELDSQLISEPVGKSMDACQMSSRDASLEIGVPGNSPLRNSEDTSFQCSSEAADITSHEDTTNVLSNGELHEEARSPNNGALNSLEHSTYPSTGQTSLETEAHLVSNAEVNSLEPSRSSCTDQTSLETETHMLSNDELNPLEHSMSVDQSSLEKDADISLTTLVGIPNVSLSSEATEAAMSSSLDDTGSEKSTQSNGVLVHEDRNDPIVEDENCANGMTVEVRQPPLSCLPTGAASLNGSLEDLCMNDEIEHHSPSSNGFLIDKQEHLKANPAHKRNVKPAFAPGFLNKPPKKKPSVNGDRSHSRINGAAESSNAETGVLKTDQSADSRVLMNGDRNSVLSNGFARPAVNNLKSCSANNGIAVGGASEGCGIGMDLADNCKRRRAAATK